MPVSSELAADLAQATVDLYTEAEQILLARIAKAIAAGLDSPAWAEEQLLTVQAVRRTAVQLLMELQTAGQQAVGQAITTAYNRGGAAAVADLTALLGGDFEEFSGPLATVTGRAPAARLVAETASRIAATHGRILRSVDDGYREVIAAASGQALLGTMTRREAAQRALDQLARRGITGFVDKAGRGWDLASYVEMATRAATAQAAVNAHADRLVAYGMDLVIVSDAPQECEACRPWEGRVLSLTGGTIGTVTGSGGVRVAGSLAAAREAGLLHPGCRHSLSLFQPGVTKVPTGTADPEGDRARQRLRYLERQVRAARRQEAAALDDTARRSARARVKAGRDAIAAHVATTSAKRQPQRERLGAR